MSRGYKSQIEVLRKRQQRLAQIDEARENGRGPRYSLSRHNELDAEYDDLGKQIARLRARMTGEWKLLDETDGTGLSYILEIDGAEFLPAHCDDCGCQLAEVIDTDADYEGEESGYSDASTYRCVRCLSVDVTANRGPKDSLLEAIARTLFPVEHEESPTFDPIAIAAQAQQ